MQKEPQASPQRNPNESKIYPEIEVNTYWGGLLERFGEFVGGFWGMFGEVFERTAKEITENKCGKLEREKQEKHDDNFL